MEVLSSLGMFRYLDVFLNLLSLQDGYIDKDELYFVLDSVGTFKKVKWSCTKFCLSFSFSKLGQLVASATLVLQTQVEFERDIGQTLGRRRHG